MDRLIYTVGYEGREITEFIRLLGTQRVVRLADVRNSPYSRIRGFSKDELEEALPKSGVEYRNFTSLGAPRSLRGKSEDMGWEEFLIHYRRHFESNRPDYMALVDFLGDAGGAIMCLERDSDGCHRSVIEDELRKDGYRIVALGDEPRKIWF